MKKIFTMQVTNFLIKALRAFGAQGKFFYVAGTISNVFKYVATILQPNSRLIILALFISYYFPIIEKSCLNIFNILGYFFIILVVGFIKSNSNSLDLLKILLFSLNRAMFRILSLNFIKLRLIYLILFFPFLLIIFGDYTYLFLNFGLIFNNLKLLQKFMLNKDDECLSKI